MVHGYTLPRTPKGTSSLVTAPPWHYAGNCLAVEYEGQCRRHPGIFAIVSGDAIHSMCCIFCGMAICQRFRRRIFRPHPQPVSRNPFLIIRRF